MSGIGYFGCKPDPIDHRDQRKVYGPGMVPSSLQHPTVDLRQYVTGIYNQGQLNSCTANAVCSAYKLDLKKESMTPGSEMYAAAPLFDPSRLFLYYNSRAIENLQSLDSGASIRDTIKSIAKGVCRETTWPYDIKKVTSLPPGIAYGEATGNIVSRYENLSPGVNRSPDVNQLQACLKENCPFVFGFKAYERFYNYDRRNCVMQMPIPNKKEVGGHAGVAVGYNDGKGLFTILNSWGEVWGDEGYFYMPYDVISHPGLCRDFWKITFAKQRVYPAQPREQMSCQGYN